ncbi:MAG: putative toxin-antitoxin system toxin component, PIN family [Rhodocyclaceae bacterium]|nr:putative toxin-antitoxin system toxin component, PIN family [Rhodocyclaceae bacterium]
MPGLRVVLDTNVLLSGIAYPASIPGRLLAAWRAGSLDVLLSAYILEELRRVMPRLAHRHGLTSAEVDCLVDSLFIQVDLVEPEMAPVIALRDAADLAVLGTLIAAGQVGGACYLVTGDKDLLALAASYPIVTPATFWAIHGSDSL